jgi:hypothetical protein
MFPASSGHSFNILYHQPASEHYLLVFLLLKDNFEMLRFRKYNIKLVVNDKLGRKEKEAVVV